MSRTPRWAAAAVLALSLTACGGGTQADDPTVGAGSGPSADTGLAAPSDPAAPSAPEAPSAPVAPVAACATKAKPIPAPAGIGTDLRSKPKIPANAGAPATSVEVADVVVGTGATADPGRMVAVKYVGALDKTGREFDSSWSRGATETLPYTVCGQDVVTGFSVAPVGMKVGGRRLIRIPDAFGYPGGNPQAGIPAGAVITFVIDLVSVS